MSNDILERAAQAIAQHGLVFTETTPAQDWAEKPEFVKERYRGDARAAITELLQTTPEQRQAARDIPFTHLINERNVAIYQAMLRVALGEGGVR